MNKFEMLEYWYAARDAEIGIVLRCSSPEHAKTLLYSARKFSGDESLANLQIRVSPEHPETDLWIMKKENRNGA